MSKQQGKFHAGGQTACAHDSLPVASMRELVAVLKEARGTESAGRNVRNAWH